MGKKELGIGLAIAAVAIVAIALFTNIFELAKPGLEKSINVTETAASGVTVKGKDLVAGVKTVTSDVQNVTSHLKIKNPLP